LLPAGYLSPFPTFRFCLLVPRTLWLLGSLWFRGVGRDLSQAEVFLGDSVTAGAQRWCPRHRRHLCCVPAAFVTVRHVTDRSNVCWQVRFGCPVSICISFSMGWAAGSVLPAFAFSGHRFSPGGLVAPYRLRRVLASPVLGRYLYLPAAPATLSPGACLGGRLCVLPGPRLFLHESCPRFLASRRGTARRSTTGMAEYSVSLGPSSVTVTALFRPTGLLPGLLLHASCPQFPASRRGAARRCRLVFLPFSSGASVVVGRRQAGITY
jgi:hypothetical protein